METTPPRLNVPAAFGLIFLLLASVWTTFFLAHVLFHAPMAMAWVITGVVAFMNAGLYLPWPREAASAI